MPQAPTRIARKKGSTFSGMAAALYPTDLPDAEEPNEEVSDGQDSSGNAEGDASEDGKVGRTPMQEMANSLYPEAGQDEADPSAQDSGDSDGVDEEGDGGSDDPTSDDADSPSGADDDKDEPGEKVGKQKLPEYQQVPTPTANQWKDIAKIAQPMRRMTQQKDPAKALLYGHTDKDYEKRTGKGGQISELQKKLGVTVTGVYDTRTKNALESAFVQMMLPWAEKAQKETGVPALVTIGQAWLESGHGLEIPSDRTTGKSSNNLFGMKARDGRESVTAMTQERDRKTDVTSNIVQPFEVHASLEDSVMQHAWELHNGTDTFRKNNPGYATMVSSRDPAVWAQGLDKAGHATAKNYAQALTASMNRVAKLISISKGNKQ